MRHIKPEHSSSFPRTSPCGVIFTCGLVAYLRTKPFIVSFGTAHKLQRRKVLNVLRAGVWRVHGCGEHEGDSDARRRASRCKDVRRPAANGNQFSSLCKACLPLERPSQANHEHKDVFPYRTQGLARCHQKMSPNCVAHIKSQQLTQGSRTHQKVICR